MPFIDNVIGWISPEAALRRQQARQMLSMLRSYDAAQTGRRTANWKAGGGSANNEIAPALGNLRNRSRELVRNNPYAKRAINGLTAKSVGTGITAKTEKSVANNWKLWTEDCDFDDRFDYYGLQNLAARTGFESGECVVRRIRVSGGFGLKLQVLEPDYIDSAKFGPTSNGNFVIAGVEVNRAGQRVALWLFDQHPGDVAYLTRKYESRRVPWDDVIHHYEQERPGQLRGIPRLSVAMMKARDHDDLDDAQLMRKKIEACFAAFVNGGDPSQAIGNSNTDNTVTPPKREETLSPGMIYYTRTGESVTFGSPTATTDEAFSKRQLRAIAVGTGVTYELMTGDLSDVNYSSIRAGMLDFRELVETWRWIHYIPQVCRRTYRWWEDAAWTAGRIRSTGYAIDWTPPQWPMVDQQKEITADKEEVLGGLSTLSEKIRARGRNPIEVYDETEFDLKELDKRGICVDTDGRLKLKIAAAKPKGDGAVEPAPNPAEEAAA
jgi:lambda family phage portal protein